MMTTARLPKPIPVQLHVRVVLVLSILGGLLPNLAAAQTTRQQVERLAASIAQVANTAKGTPEQSAQARLLEDLQAFNRSKNTIDTIDWPSTTRWLLACGLDKQGQAHQSTTKAHAASSTLFDASCEQWQKAQRTPTGSQGETDAKRTPNFSALLEHTRHGVPLAVLSRLYEAGLTHSQSHSTNKGLADKALQKPKIADSVAKALEPSATARLDTPLTPITAKASTATSATSATTAAASAVTVAPNDESYFKSAAFKNMLSTALDLIQLAILVYMLYWACVWIWGRKTKRSLKLRKTKALTQPLTGQHTQQSVANANANSAIVPLSEADQTLQRQQHALQQWAEKLHFASDSVRAFTQRHAQALDSIADGDSALASHKLSLGHYQNAVEQALRTALEQYAKLSDQPLILSLTRQPEPQEQVDDAALMLGQVVSSCIDLQVWLAAQDKKTTAVWHWAQFVWPAITQLHFYATLAQNSNKASTVPALDYEDEAAPATVSNPPPEAAIDRVMSDAVKTAPHPA